jgi:cellulose 1,4-beta-cellobiosidase
VALEAAAAAVRWVQLQEHTGPGGRDGTQQQPPDPWRSAGDGAVLDTARAGAPAAHANGHSSSSSSSGSSSSGSSSSGGSSSGSSSGGSSYSVMSSGNGAASHAPVHGGKCAQAGGERSDGGKQDAVSGAPAGAEHAGATGSA